MNRLANVGKTCVRERIVTEIAFPKDKDMFIWECIQCATKDNKMLQDLLKKASDDPAVKEKLIEFVEC
jgi:hypothetical protein